jgi:uncharacterized oligopeptide transporter (OPT) family protein
MMQPTTTNIIIILIGFAVTLLAAYITKQRVQKSFIKIMHETYQGIIKDQDNTIVNLRTERDLERKDTYKMKDHIQILILEVERIKHRQCKRINCPNRI